MFAFMNTQPTQATTTVHYVAPGGVCGDRNPCYATVQSAVDAAETGDEIRIAEGVYTEINHYSGLAQSVVYLSKTVTLCGGYCVEDKGHLMPLSHPAILDAQSAG